MVCPNCKHEISPSARVCPACGAPVSAPQPVPTVVIAPPAAPGRPAAPVPPRQKKKTTAARVFTILFCLLAVAMDAALAAFWFLPCIRVADNASPASLTAYSMFSLTWDAAAYLTIAVCALCLLSAVFCVIPLFRGQSLKRKRLWIPKIAAILCALCYAVPYTVASLAAKLNALINGGDVHHHNPFTAICFWLFILLWVISELTISHRSTIQQRQIEDLKAQLLQRGIQPEEW